MTENTAAKTITINETEYNIEELTQEQVDAINLINSTDSKIKSLQGEASVLQAGREAILKALVENLSKDDNGDS